MADTTSWLGTVSRAASLTSPPNEKAVEVNLRLPSMVSGKKGFNRLVWAFTKELTETVSWLFLDLQTTKDRTFGIRHWHF
jgi:ribonuclease P/MRP protein subunit RPP40